MADGAGCTTTHLIYSSIPYIHIVYVHKHKRVMLVDDDGVMSSYQCCFIAFNLLNQQPLYSYTL